MDARLSVMISSTARDLPEHRKQVIAACERLGYFPLPMENLPADPGDAVRVSLGMVDAAHVYVGIFAHRYGYVPDGHDRSVTEMEYDRARERGLPCLIFFMHDDHDIKASDVEKGAGAEKLSRFKERLGTSHVAGFFRNADDLRAQVLHALTALKKPETSSLHHASDIPEPPETYVAHPYVLLQTRQLVGRQAELNLLTDWVASPRAEVYAARVLSLVAIGGMGKSALTWKWFHDVAPLEMKPLAGRLWWSFYESDASFDNFLVRALAYVSRRPREEVEELSRRELEERLFQILNREPFLLVLDGLERVLVAYARFDAAHLADEEMDKQTDNRVTGQAEIVGPHRLRKTADPRAGAFLKRLAQVRASRVLVSTRLYPSDLQNAAGQPLPGCHAHFLLGLSEDDAVNLWRSLGVSGTREQLLPLFRTFGSHPLLVQTLAGAIANYRAAPGDFERWRRDNPHFDPFRLPLTQVKTHVLQQALAGLDEAARKVLESAAGFRMPASYETLAALHVEDSWACISEELRSILQRRGGLTTSTRGKTCATANELHLILEELEGRGLLGWDRRANRYDLHPIVRGVTWSSLSGDARQGIYGALTAHFEAMPQPASKDVKRIEDLAPAVELFNSLIGLGRYEDALKVFRGRLDEPLLYLLAAFRERNELLGMFFLDAARLPDLLSLADKLYVWNSAGMGYDLLGLPDRALALHREAHKERGVSRRGDPDVALYLWSHAAFTSGRLHEAETRLRELHAYGGSRAPGLFAVDYLPALLTLWESRGEGRLPEARHFLERYARYDAVTTSFPRLRLVPRLRGWDSLVDAGDTLRPDQEHSVFGNDSIFDARAAYRLGCDQEDDGLLQDGLREVRRLGMVEEELTFLLALADSKRRKGESADARTLLADLWEPAEAGPYPLLHADGRNLLAAFERDAGNPRAAAEAALRAYRLAWCDGPPFAYATALETARDHLAALGVPEPKLPPYDDSRHEPLPEISFDPPPDDLITD